MTELVNVNTSKIVNLYYKRDLDMKLDPLNQITNSLKKLGYYNIKSAIYYKFYSHHILPSNTNAGVAGSEMHTYFSKHKIDIYDLTEEIYPTIYKTMEI